MKETHSEHRKIHSGTVNVYLGDMLIGEFTIKDPYEIRVAEEYRDFGDEHIPRKENDHEKL